MGTSTPNKGPKNKTPLVPSFLDDNDNSDKKTAPNDKDKKNPTTNNNSIEVNRFKESRSNFSRFATSGGSDTNSLKKALYQYVSSGTGGSKNATTRMKSSKIVAGKIFSLFQDINRNGLSNTLKTYNLDQFIDKPINQILTSLVNIVCLNDIADGGDIDQGIARYGALDALENICSKVDSIEDLQNYPIEAILETFITQTIKKRVLNDIGSKEITYPKNTKDIDFIENQLDYFIEGAVEQSLSKHIDHSNNISNREIQQIIESIYESSFEVLRVLGEEYE